MTQTTSIPTNVNEEVVTIGKKKWTRREDQLRRGCEGRGQSVPSLLKTSHHAPVPLSSRHHEAGLLRISLFSGQLGKAGAKTWRGGERIQVGGKDD